MKLGIMRTSIRMTDRAHQISAGLPACGILRSAGSTPGSGRDDVRPPGRRAIGDFRKKTIVALDNSVYKLTGRSINLVMPISKLVMPFLNEFSGGFSVKT